MQISSPITLDQLTTLIDERAELKANALISKALGGAGFSLWLYKANLYQYGRNCCTNT